MTEQLIIDLAACDRCASCTVECAGLLSLREKATFELLCRRCEQASCILACPFGALERIDDGGVIRRHNLRCVSCKLCAQACPFGTIYPELLPFYSLSYESSCQACLETNRGHGPLPHDPPQPERAAHAVGADARRDSASASLPAAKPLSLHDLRYARDFNSLAPPCVAACHEGALEYREIGAAEEGVHILDEHLAARADKWIRDEPVPEATA